MKILVPIKRVVDYNVKVRPLSDNSNVDLNNVKMAVNPFCEIALEEAVRLKESGKATEVIAVSVGQTDSQEQLRTALALGADRATLVETDSLLEPLAIAKVLQKITERRRVLHPGPPAQPGGPLLDVRCAARGAWSSVLWSLRRPWRAPGGQLCGRPTD